MVISTDNEQEQVNRRMWQKEQILLILLIPLHPIKGKDLYALTKFYQQQVGYKLVFPIKTREELRKQLRILIKNEKVFVKEGRYIVSEMGKKEARSIFERLTTKEEKAWSRGLMVGRKILHETGYTPINFAEDLRVSNEQRKRKIKKNRFR
ncbi:MAG: hypothetical protein KAR35_07515 [Candidatus Heimdallarchaeota archaeon]|nr:hypothetical protein [Candidatus Heimdallarchaeota archaeon]MCK5049208.1 hypothetical protein [Candidatus Heimdallarchaeota archaeon]